MAARYWKSQPISAIADNGSGGCLLTVTSTTGMVSGGTSQLFGITGTTALNGAQVIFVIDSTHVNVAGVPFVATGTGSINGNWDAANSNNWVSTSGGVNFGQTIPAAADTVTLDANSGGGTIIVAANLAITSITMGAFTGTLDFSVNNNTVALGSSSVTGSFSVAGAGVRTLNLGSSVFTIQSTGGTPLDFSTITNLTLNAGTSKFIFTSTGNGVGTRQIWAPNGGSLYDLQFGPELIGSSKSAYNLNVTSFGSCNLHNLTVIGPCYLAMGGAVLTLSGTVSITGTGYSAACLFSGAGTHIAVNGSVPTVNWACFLNTLFSGTYGVGFTATNSIDLGGNSTFTIKGPSGGAAGIIGGG